MEQFRGKLRQKDKNGPYYYRLTVANGLRKEFALKPCNYDEACQKAADLDAVWNAPNKEVAFAQINAIKGFSRQAMNLPLSEGWRKYEVHPDRATPHTVSEQLAYQSTYEEFVQFASNPSPSSKTKHIAISSISELSTEVCEGYSAYLKRWLSRLTRTIEKLNDCVESLIA